MGLSDTKKGKSQMVGSDANAAAVFLSESAKLCHALSGEIICSQTK